jgi:hypothetical protein
MRIHTVLVFSSLATTECARDLSELVSCCKFVNEKFFFIIYKKLYLTWGHNAQGVILSLLIIFELSTAELILQSQRSLKNWVFNIFVNEGQDPWHTRYLYPLNSASCRFQKQLILYCSFFVMNKSNIGVA